MAATQEYLRSAKKALRCKIEATPGVFETMGDDDFVPIEDFTQKLNPKTTASTEKRGTIAEGEPVISGFQPDLSGSLLLRGAPDAATAPRIGRIIQVCGFSEDTEAIIPSSGTTTADAGTTTSFDIDRTAGTGTQWPAENGALIGRPIELAGNPATAEIVVCVDYRVVGDIATVTIHKTMGTALSGATTAKVFPGTRWKVTSDVPPALSVETWIDGKRRQITGVRGNLKWSLPGGEAMKFNLDLFGSYVADDDEDTPVPDFSTLPPGGQWRDGLAFLDRLEVAGTSLDIDTGNEKTRHPNPNVEPGFDVALITKRKVNGTFQVNMSSKATQDRVGGLEDNEKVPLVAASQLTGEAGSRWIVTMPAFKKLNVDYADKEGIADDSIPYQAIELLGDDELVLVNF